MIFVAFFVSPHLSKRKWGFAYHKKKQEYYYIITTQIMFTPASRDWSMVRMPSKANTDYPLNSMVYNDGTDNVPVATTTQGNVKGIVQKAKASAANTDDIYLLTPNSVNSTFYADVTGTLTKAMEGDQFDFADSLHVAQGTSTYDTVELVKFISASKGVFKFNHTLGIEN